MTAVKYAITTRSSMGCASEQLLQDYQDGKLKYHHDALVTGYTSVKGDQYASYDGRFGRGIVVFSNYTTVYSRISYYLEVE